MTNGPRAVEARVLRAPPESGSIKEAHFDAFGLATWVRFDLENGESWAGAFGRGESRADDVAIFDGGRHAIVIAHGRGYVVNVERRSMCYRTEEDYLVSAIAHAELSFGLACDFVRLLAIGPGGVLWESGHIAQDGIEFLRCKPQEVVGRVERSDGWHRFSLRFDGWQYHQEQRVLPYR